MRESYYAVFVLVNGSWECAKQGRTSRSCAEGWLAQFAMQYRARLMVGYQIGRLVKEIGPK